MSSVLEWLHAIECPCMSYLDTNKLGEAIARGAVEAARFIMDALARAHPGNKIHIEPHYIDTAALSGHVAAIALADDEGLCDWSEQALRSAARHGQIDVLRWAAGETRRGGQPVPAWTCSTMADVASIAVYIARRDIVMWLLALPEVTPMVRSRTLVDIIHAGQTDLLIAVHDSGLARVDAPVVDGRPYGLLVEAIAWADSPPMLAAMLDRGCPITEHALVVTLQCAQESSRAVVFEKGGLCALYSHYTDAFMRSHKDIGGA